MIAVLLILIPLLTGLAAFFFRDEKAVRSWALFSSLLTLAVSILGLTVFKEAKYLSYQCEWMQGLGSSFSVGLDGMGQVLCLLTAVAYPVIFLATWNSSYKKANNFFALMLLAQVGLMGVFLAMDALLFYFAWELALIPVYFLCSQWGGERRIPVTFKFFIYTFLGSVLMLIGILYVYSHTPDQSFA
ncbi:MAG: NADH-quinone oxidoreductase subunit M, partial [Chitinophagaceae bacterium]